MCERERESLAVRVLVAVELRARGCIGSVCASVRACDLGWAWGEEREKRERVREKEERRESDLGWA